MRNNPADLAQRFQEEKDQIRKMIKYFHPDSGPFGSASPADKKRAEDIVKTLNEFVHIHKDKKLIAESDWPRDPKGDVRQGPIDVPLIGATPDGNFVRVNMRFQQPASPKNFYDLIKRFHADPVKYHADVVARNKAAAAEEERRAQAIAAQAAAAEARRAEAMRAAQEAAERATHEERAREAEIVSLKESIVANYGVKFDESFDRMGRMYGAGRSAEAALNNLKTIRSAFEKVGAPIATIKDSTLHVMHYGDTRFETYVKFLAINVNDNPEKIAHDLLQTIGLIERRKEALKSLQPFQFQGSLFDSTPLEKLIEFAGRIKEAAQNADNLWIVQSPLVEYARISISHIDAKQARYSIFKTDPGFKARVTFEIGVDADTEAIGKAINDAGAELIKFYPEKQRAPHQRSHKAERLQSHLGIRFSNKMPESKLVTPERQSEFYDRFKSAFEKLSEPDRMWLRNMRVEAPTEGTRLLGRNIGSREATVHKNRFIAPYDISEENILAALHEEIRKKKEA